MSNVNILASTNILKCRFCNFDEDDSARWVTIGEGEIKDPHFDLVYNRATGTLKDATKLTRYAYVECPALKCTRYYLEGDCIEESKKNKFISLEDMLVRVSETEDEFLKNFPMKPSLNITRMVEYGTVICQNCCYYNEQDNSEKQFSIIYNPVISKQPLLRVYCKPHHPCEHGLFICKPGSHYEGLVQLKESEILKTLGLTAEPLESLEVCDPEKNKKEIEEMLKKIMAMPEVIEINVLSRYLETLTGKKVEIL